MSLTAVWGALFFLIGLAGTWLARRYALARRLIDQPGERRSHTVATPRGGGIAIVAATLAGGAVAWVAQPAEGGVIAAFATGMAMVAAVGWVDDHRPLSPAFRLAVHIVASGLYALAVQFASADPAAALVAFIAPLVLTNVWNFMDGIDGLAASQALIVAGLLAIVLEGPWRLVALALAAASAGFLPFNLPRARIFMGDVGSGAIGYAIGALCAVPVVRQGPASAWLLMPLAPFLVDAGLTLARRVLRGERWWTAHTQHAYQVLARRAGHLPVTAGYALAAGAGAAGALVMKGTTTVFIASCLFTWYTSAAISWGWLQRCRAAAVGDGAGPPHKENK